jgi:hypothetical protein
MSKKRYRPKEIVDRLRDAWILLCIIPCAPGLGECIGIL